ncbi:composite domain of metallo-dependent hydrolase [Coprinopsis marcescibilis]|uniref:Composite domain of metallo-dependent hydrolase n=1 Tax=Coprinopsis marcescibilis TaxID=230819 RepID=A0A5C3KZD5_COPMA|nr:composite domain of metallo-dependent hydrolase [Coprinopsis marcescibilis]
MDDKPLPTYHGQRAQRSSSRSLAFKGLLAAVLLVVGPLTYFSNTVVDLSNKHSSSPSVPINAQAIINKCKALDVLPGPPKDFGKRKESDRFEPGTKPVLIRNATIWTGRDDGKEVLKGDVLLAHGVVKSVGDADVAELAEYADVVTVDAEGAWVTPGIVDAHSHMGVDSAPELEGAEDTNSFKGLTLPWLRSLDGLNTHDDAYRLSISGGVTTANILPGSADAIGGQAFTIKLRPTKERTPTSKLLEPPFSLNATAGEDAERPRWRQMKHACGENPSRVYDGTRMDTQWAFRNAYETARKLKVEQDEYCSKAVAGRWTDLGAFPENLQWEALIDVLRGRVKVHNHCYEAVDLDNMVRLTNEFKFSIAAFHHAHETYLVPDLLKKAYGGPPAIALFATNARYKREAYRGSEFAPKILTDNGLKVVMKSDHPVLNSRFLLNEAQQAHYYGLSEHLALSSVISTPATILGYDHRIGFLNKGYDADIVIWDSHPLQIGATPKQVYIDGIPQLKKPHVNSKPSRLQKSPQTPDFKVEIKETLEHDGLPPLVVYKAKADVVIFKNVSSLHVREGTKVKEVFDVTRPNALGENGDGVYKVTDVVVENGNVVCVGVKEDCLKTYETPSSVIINLERGSISPALVSFGSPLALNHIDQEASANDGRIVDVLTSSNSGLLGPGPLIRAVDGLLFETRDALLGYRAGVTVGVTAPTGGSFIQGLSTAFDTGAPHKLSNNAVLQQVTALHVGLLPSSPSVSTQIAALRNLLKGESQGDLGKYFKLVAEGEIPLVIDVHSADVISTVIELKKEVDSRLSGGRKTQFTLVGANEAHLIAKEIGAAGIGVILNPARPYPEDWKSQRILPGPPLSAETSATLLRKHNVTVGLGILEQWQARSTRFDVAWTALDSNGRITKTEAIELVTANLEQLLGVRKPNLDLVAVKRGSLHDFEGQVVGIISSRQRGVNLI